MHTDLKLSGPLDEDYTTSEANFTPVCHGCKVLVALTRLLTLVQVGVCRKYALEAIINVIIYFHDHNYVYIPCYNCYGSRVYNNHEARRKTHMHVWNNKRINIYS